VKRIASIIRVESQLMEAIRSSETSVVIIATRCHITEDGILETAVRYAPLQSHGSTAVRYAPLHSHGRTTFRYAPLHSHGSTAVRYAPLHEMNINPWRCSGCRYTAGRTAYTRRAILMTRSDSARSAEHRRTQGCGQYWSRGQRADDALSHVI
jgi:hypothetical protein